MSSATRYPKCLRFALAILLLGLVTTTAAAQCSGPSASKTIFLVRHAEKAADDPRDPTLTAAGQARAEALLHALENAGVTALYATEFKRTQLTLAPLAAKLHLETTIVPARDVAGLIKRLTDARGGVSVVAGHSNSVDKVIDALGAGKVGPIDDAVYDNLFVVTISASGEARLLKLKFGQPTPSSGKPMVMK